MLVLFSATNAARRRSQPLQPDDRSVGGGGGGGDDDVDGNSSDGNSSLAAPLPYSKRTRLRRPKQYPKATVLRLAPAVVTIDNLLSQVRAQNECFSLTHRTRASHTSPSPVSTAGRLVV